MSKAPNWKSDLGLGEDLYVEKCVPGANPGAVVSPADGVAHSFCLLFKLHYVHFHKLL